MRIRQVALVANELEPVAEQLRSVLSLSEPFRDEGVGTFGLENVVFAVGDTFLEVVSPKQPETSAGRLLERRGGDGGYMVIVQTDDMVGDRARLDRLGVRVVWEIALDDIATIHLHPRDVGGAILSLDQPVPPGSWRWGGPDWPQRSASPVALGIVGAEIQCGDPAARAERWSAVLGHPTAPAGPGVHEISLDGSRLRFVPDRNGRGEGVAGLTLAVRDPGEVLERARQRELPVDGQGFEACGARFELSAS